MGINVEMSHATTTRRAEAHDYPKVRRKREPTSEEDFYSYSSRSHVDEPREGLGKHELRRARAQYFVRRPPERKKEMASSGQERRPSLRKTSVSHEKAPRITVRTVHEEHRHSDHHHRRKRRESEDEKGAGGRKGDSSHEGHGLEGARRESTSRARHVRKVDEEPKRARRDSRSGSSGLGWLKSSAEKDKPQSMQRKRETKKDESQPNVQRKSEPVTVTVETRTRSRAPVTR